MRIASLCEELGRFRSKDSLDVFFITGQKA
jgi:hypothetical protein